LENTDPFPAIIKFPLSIISIFFVSKIKSSALADEKIFLKLKIKI
jgi:hypothetical protein